MQHTILPNLLHSVCPSSPANLVIAILPSLQQKEYIFTYIHTFQVKILRVQQDYIAQLPSLSPSVTFVKMVINMVPTYLPTNLPTNLPIHLTTNQPV